MLFCSGYKNSFIDYQQLKQTKKNFIICNSLHFTQRRLSKFSSEIILNKLSIYFCKKCKWNAVEFLQLDDMFKYLFNFYLIFVKFHLH